MPMERIHMRKIREVLRLKYDCNLSNRQIARSCNVSKETVRKYLSRSAAAGLSWPLLANIDDLKLEQLLFPSEFRANKAPLPNWDVVHQELKRKSMTKWLLWEEYKEVEPNGISYSRFCRLYNY